MDCEGLEFGIGILGSYVCVTPHLLQGYLGIVQLSRVTSSADVGLVGLVDLVEL